MVPIANKITYGGTKTFVQYMCEALSVEVKDRIDVMSMHPGLVSSNMCTLPPGGPCATTKDVVTACLKNLGHEAVSVGVWRHEWDMLNVIRYR